MEKKPPNCPDQQHLITSELMRDLRLRLDALVMRGSDHARRHDPVRIEDMLDLYELSARLELLIETLDARRRMHTDVYGPYEDVKRDD